MDFDDGLALSESVSPLYNAVAMSLTTQCPACSTIFKVVPDQLRISEGWVRCGQCGDVFDANQHLQTPPVTNGSNPQNELTDQCAKATGADCNGTSIASPTAASEALDLDSELLREALHGPSDGGVEVDATPATDQELTPELHDIVAPNDVGVDPPLDSVCTVSTGDTKGLTDATLSPLELEPEIPLEHSFLRKAQSQSRWTAPWVHALLALIGMGLMAGLIFQFVHFERNRIAAMFPASKPYLETLCQTFGCEISIYRQIEAVVIESSNFTKVRTDVYQLNATLRNTGLIEVEVPALELSLTNLQDQPIIRRVFSTAELAKQLISIAPGSDLHITLSVKLVQNTDTERIAGYRLLAFYP